MRRYTRTEQRLRKAAFETRNNPNSTLVDLERARKTLDRLSKARQSPPDQPALPEPDADGWQPTAAQQAVLDRLDEDGKEEQAEVWRLVYKMETADLEARKAAPEIAVLPDPPSPPDPPVAPTYDGQTVPLDSLFPGLTDGNVADWSAQDEAERRERAGLIAQLDHERF